MTNWEDEIVALHDFFEGYIAGTLEQGDTGAMDVLDQNFTMVNPDGTMSNKSALVEAIGNMHGRIPSMKMSIEEAELLVETDELVVARYVEVQEYEDGSSRRRSTVVFEKASNAANGVVWRNVHETMLDC